MQVDVHWHHVPETLVRRVLDGSVVIDGEVVRTSEPVEFRLTMGMTMPLTDDLWRTSGIAPALDLAGHDHVLASLPPQFMAYEMAVDGARAFSRAVNEAWAETAAAVPGGRVVPLAQVPLQVPEEAAKELRFAVAEYGFPGVAIRSNVAGTNLGDDTLLPFWEAVAETDSFVFIHPQTPLGAERLRRHQLVNFVGLPIDTAAAVASLIFEGVYARFETLKTCFAHAGGAFPYLLGRWDHGIVARAASGFRIDRKPSEFLGNIYCDSLSHSERGLQFLVDVMGADHVVLGSDHPFDMGEADPNGAMERAIGDPAVRSLIRGETAARLVGLA